MQPIDNNSFPSLLLREAEGWEEPELAEQHEAEVS